MQLFDTYKRTELRWKKGSESVFEYYNLSARPAVEALRQLLECWFARLPENGKNDLCSRFRSTKDSNWQGAFFELYVHELFTCLGFELQVHPRVEGVSTRPDFSATSCGVAKFFVEATVAGLLSDQEQGADRRMEVVYEAINTIQSPDFFLELEIRGAPDTAPPTKKLRDDLTKWLSTLNAEAIAQLYVSGRVAETPSFPWQHEGWSLLFRPLPKSPNLRGKSGVRPIGIRSPEGVWLSTDAEIREAAEGKAKRYGELERPLIVAVNYVGLHCNNIDIMNALYGQESTVVRLHEDGRISERNERKPNGLWFGQNGPRNKPVSGVLFTQVNPWNMGGATPELFHNPWSVNPIQSSEWPLAQCVADLSEKRVRHQPGHNVGDLLGLPTTWPVADC
jgi:hypothetical protein